MSAQEATATSDRPDLSIEIAALLPVLARIADREAVVLCLADTLACALGAEALADKHGGTVSRLRGLSPSAGGAATIWATGEKADTDTAALRNAVAARYLDWNDTYVARAIIHPSDLLAALVALAEERAIAWDRLIEAAGVAYEVVCRMADQADLRRRGFDGSTLSPIGAAAGAAWLLSLDEEASARALRIAALDAATLKAVRQGKLSDWKAIASARGALKGLFAARMAEAGFLAPDNVYGGDEGFLATVSGPLALDAEGGSRMTRIILKAHPAQIFIQGMLQLAAELRPRLADRLDSIQSVTVRTFKQAVDMVGGKAHPVGAAMNRETADHSAAFAIAAVLAAGRLGHADFERLLSDATVHRLIGRTNVEEDAAANRAFPVRFSSRITVALDDGTVLAAEQDNPVPLRPQDLSAKFAELWPSHLARGWRWDLPGVAPRFPVGHND